MSPSDAVGGSTSMRRWVLRAGVLLGLVAAVFALRQTVFAPQPTPVQVAVVARGRVEESITNSKAGTVEARRRAKLSPGTSGIVIEFLARRGDRVAQGDLLLRIDDREQRARLELSERAVDVASARHRMACVAAARALRELNRNLQLVEDNVVSIDRIDLLESAHEMAVAECDVAAAEVEQSRAALITAQVELDKTRLLAPFDAIIAEDSVEVGEWVTPSVPLLAAPELIDAIDLSSLYISAPMDEVDAAKLRPGLPARATIDSHPGRSFSASVLRVAPYVLDVEQQNRTIEIEVELEDAALAATLLPGTSADVEVVLSARDDALRVPTHALLEGSRVLVVVDGILEERVLELGLRNWDFVEVLAGLEQGDQVVTSLDRSGTQAGARVEVVGDGDLP